MDADTTSAAHPLLAERFVVLTVALGSMLAPLNSSMIAVALPEVMHEFHVEFGSAVWLVTAYLIAMASLQPVAGKIGDSIGRGRLVLSGLMGFGLASLGATIAPSLWMLIGLRVVQAGAGAMIVPNAARPRPYSGPYRATQWQVWADRGCRRISSRGGTALWQCVDHHGRLACRVLCEPPASAPGRHHWLALAPEG